MSYLMHICFDNDRRLARKSYLFEYKGIQFKLIQGNPRKWADHLLTLLPDESEIYREEAFAVASEFLSALCWELNSRIMVWENGGRSWHKDNKLSKAKPTAFTFPKIPFGGNIQGYYLYSIPKIETEFQRIALTLYREARASNNEYLSFMFYWQVLETRNTNATNYVDNIRRKKRKEINLKEHYIESLPLNGKSLGNYLEDDCRHAIAHIRRSKGKKKLDLDNVIERRRIANSTVVVRAFAEHYIKHSIELKDSLYLVRKSKNSFPIFADNEFIENNNYTSAYKIFDT